MVLTNSQTLERVLDVDRIYIDKTGTLTTDTPSIERTETLANDPDQPDYLALAAGLQQPDALDQRFLEVIVGTDFRHHRRA